jgi:hypothetical protein
MTRATPRNLAQGLLLACTRARGAVTPFRSRVERLRGSPLPHRFQAVQRLRVVGDEHHLMTKKEVLLEQRGPSWEAAEQPPSLPPTPPLPMPAGLPSSRMKCSTRLLSFPFFLSFFPFLFSFPFLASPGFAKASRIHVCEQASGLALMMMCYKPRRVGPYGPGGSRTTAHARLVTAAAVAHGLEHHL